MKRILICMFATLLAIGLVGCSIEKTSGPKIEIKKVKDTPKEVIKEVTVDEVISAFKNAGLDAENPRKMTKDDFGLGPMKADEAKIIILPSVCEDCGARVFSYKNVNDLDQMKKYYDDLGKESAAFFSWTIKKGNILVQLNGDLPEEKFKEYEKTVESVVK